MKSARVSFILDEDLKKSADILAKKMGLDLSSVIRLLLNDFVDGFIEIGTFKPKDLSERRVKRSKLRRSSVESSSKTEQEEVKPLDEFLGDF